MSFKKRKSTLSVVIVEDHNEVLYHIYRAIGSKLIPFDNGCMIHFDSHPDMMIPKNLDIDKIYSKEHVLNSLSIENWILPAVYAGHFSTLVWMKPVWANQLENGTHRFKIGSDNTTKEIKVTCPQSYFVSELAWSPLEELENTRDVMLEVCTMEVPETDEASGSSKSKQCVLSSDAKPILDATPFVLDIDLDFYSTRNPFLSLFTEEQFSVLRQLYHYEHPKEETEEALREVTSKRQNQLQELETAFTSLQNDTTVVETSPSLEALRSLLATFPADKPPDLSLLHDAGCTCDDCDLPHHVSSRDTVRHLVAATEEFLRTLPNPALITIARSSRDDYCPPEDVDFIQELVLDMLKSVYGDIDVKMDYDSEEENAEGCQGAASSNCPKTVNL